VKRGVNDQTVKGLGPWWGKGLLRLKGRNEGMGTKAGGQRKKGVWGGEKRADLCSRRGCVTNINRLREGLHPKISKV